MKEGELPFASVAGLSRLIAQRDVSSLELTEMMLGRIERLNPILNAFVTVAAEEARQAAEAADAALARGDSRGPLHGIPVAVKDVFATSGIRTTLGSPRFADWIPDHDASVVDRLKAAGAVILGKTNLHEWTIGATSWNAFYGHVFNPWRPGFHPGGSSGGSAAAVAAGLAYAALGSDTGGSIRQPAALCGIVGLKPTFGRVAGFGALPFAWSMDHAGPLARTVEDIAIMLSVLAGHDRRDPASATEPVPDYAAAIDAGIAGWRIGIARDYFFDECDAEFLAATEAAMCVLRELGAQLEEIELPDMRDVRAAGTVIMFSEAAAYFADDLRQRPEVFTDEIRALFELGSFFTAPQYVQAQRVRRLLTGRTIDSMQGFDAILTPSTSVPSSEVNVPRPELATHRPRCTLPFSTMGLPAMSVPCGLTADGMPAGFQLVARPFAEATLMKIARAYESVTPWSDLHPEMAA